MSKTLDSTQNSTQKNNIPFNHLLEKNSPLSEISSSLSEKIIKLFAKNLSTVNKESQTIHVIYTEHSAIIKKQISIFFKQDFKNFETFIKKLDEFFHKDIITEYKKILEENTTIYKFTTEEIENHIELIKKQYWVNIEMLKKVNNFEKIDFKKIKVPNKEEEKGGEENIKKALNKIAESKEYILPKQIITELFEKISMKLIEDFKIIFNTDLENLKRKIDINKMYSFNSSEEYKNDHNIFIYMYIINTVFEKNLEDINDFLKTIVKITEIGLYIEEINLISYFSMKKYFNIK